MKFTEFLTESKNPGANLHLEHLHDHVINRGVVGAREAINFLQSLRDMLAGQTQNKVNITTKWDGCVRHDTIIKTNYGEMTIKELHEKFSTLSNVKIMAKDLDSELPIDKMVSVLNTYCNEGNKSWIQIEVENGSSIFVTEDHEIHTKNRGWIEAGKLIEGDDITEL
jgi:hypothetical protein